MDRFSLHYNERSENRRRRNCGSRIGRHKKCGSGYACGRVAGQGDKRKCGMGSIMPGGKIVDSFLFSEVFEKELLLIKFILEEPHVSEWLILENAYSFQGEYKGLHAETMINGDKRFLPYRDRITFITREMQPELLNKEVVQDE